MKEIPLRLIAHARSGDKGSNSNIGVIAYTSAGFIFLQKYLSAEKVNAYFKPLGVTKTLRYDLPNLEAFNFILHNVLKGGGSRSLRIDSQGKALGQVLLEMPILIPDNILIKAQSENLGSNEYLIQESLK